MRTIIFQPNRQLQKSQSRSGDRMIHNSSITTAETYNDSLEIPNRQHCYITLPYNNIQRHNTGPRSWLMSQYLLVLLFLMICVIIVPDNSLVYAFLPSTKLLPHDTIARYRMTAVKLFSVTAENAEMEFRQKRTNSQQSNNDDEEKISFINSWKEVAGGFLPQFGQAKINLKETNNHNMIQRQSAAAQQQSKPSSSSSSSVPTTKPSNMGTTTSPMKKNMTPTTMRIRQLSTLQDYKHYVVDDVDKDGITITVVRFYAPWCRACQAIQQRYYRLAQKYEKLHYNEQQEQTELSSSSSTTFVPVHVRFMECPVTKDNAVLHQGLGVPSLPYGHIYHSKVGLVEEMKLNKNVFSTFESTLASYVNGYCTVTYDDDNDDVTNYTRDNDEDDQSNDTTKAITNEVIDSFPSYMSQSTFD
jgi:thiol-disulfide isomerase/thioredoxin